MVFRGADLEYDNFELIRGHSHVIKVTQRSNGRKKPYHVITFTCFFLGDKFNGSIIFDIRGQHEVLEVKVITNIRTIINYPCRPLLVHISYNLS